MTAFVCSAWQQRPQHAICWSLPSHYLVTTWSLPGHYLVTTWSLPGHCLVTTWSLPGHYLVTAWSLPGHYLVTSHYLAPAARKPWGHLSQCRCPLFLEVLAPSSAFGKGMGRRVALSFLDGSNIFFNAGRVVWIVSDVSY